MSKLATKLLTFLTAAAAPFQTSKTVMIAGKRESLFGLGMHFVLSLSASVRRIIDKTTVGIAQIMLSTVLFIAFCFTFFNVLCGFYGRPFPGKSLDGRPNYMLALTSIAKE